VSHDLRNPLNAATGHLDLLAAESDSDRIPPIERSLSRMETLIDDLLTLARDGVQVEEFVDVDLAETARERGRPPGRPTPSCRSDSTETRSGRTSRGCDSSSRTCSATRSTTGGQT